MPRPLLEFAAGNATAATKPREPDRDALAVWSVSEDANRAE